MARFKVGQIVKINPQHRELDAWQTGIRYEIIKVYDNGTYDIECNDEYKYHYFGIEENILTEV